MRYVKFRKESVDIIIPGNYYGINITRTTWDGLPRQHRWNLIYGLQLQGSVSATYKGVK